MIDKTELLRMIMENNPGQSAPFILEQYAIYLKGLADINNPGCIGVVTAEGTDSLHQTEAAPRVEKESLTRGFTRRSLKAKPEEAIQDDVILCCVCGKECQTLTERHLASHNGLTREGYLKLCGYAADQPLMSRNHLKRMKANVLKAQEARKAKMGKGAPAKKEK